MVLAGAGNVNPMHNALMVETTVCVCEDGGDSRSAKYLSGPDRNKRIPALREAFQPARLGVERDALNLHP